MARSRCWSGRQACAHATRTGRGTPARVSRLFAARRARQVKGVIPVGLVLAVLIPWDVCPLGVLLGRTLDCDRRAGLESRVVELGHRLPDLLADSRPVLTEVLDVPLIKNEPRPEGDARACPRSEVPAQPAKQIVRIGAPGDPELHPARPAPRPAATPRPAARRRNRPSRSHDP